MAVIRQYDSPVEGIQPDVQTENVLARGGAKIRADYREGGALIEQGFRGIGSQAKELGQQIDDTQTLNDVAAGAATASTMHEKWQGQWNDFLKAHPDDPNAAQTFRETVMQPQIQQFQDAFRTKRSKEWGIQHSSALLDHMNEKMAADQVNMAKVQLGNHLHTWELSAGQAVVNDFHSLSLYQQEAPKIVAQMVDADSRLTAGDAAKAKGEITDKLLANLESAAFHSIALKNPQQAQALLKSGQLTHIDPDREAQFLNQAIRNQRVDVNLAQAAADRAERKMHEHTAQDMFAQTMDAFKTGDPNAVRGLATNISQAVGARRMSAEQGASMVKFAESLTHKMETGDVIRVSPTENASVIDDFRQRATLDDDDPHHLTMGDIFKAENAGQMTLAQGDFFVKGLRETAADPSVKATDRAFNQSITALKPLLDKTFSTGLGPSFGQSFLMSKLPEMRDEFRARIAKGETASKLLDPDNPDGIFRTLRDIPTDPNAFQIFQLSHPGMFNPVPTFLREVEDKRHADANKKIRDDREQADRMLKTGKALEDMRSAVPGL